MRRESTPADRNNEDLSAIGTSRRLDVELTSPITSDYSQLRLERNGTVQRDLEDEKEKKKPARGGLHSCKWWRWAESNYADSRGYELEDSVRLRPYHHSYHFRQPAEVIRS